MIQKFKCKECECEFEVTKRGTYKINETSVCCPQCQHQCKYR